MYLSTYIWNLENHTDEHICRKRVKMQVYRTDVWTQWGKGSVGRMEKVALTYTCEEVNTYVLKNDTQV